MHFSQKDFFLVVPMTVLLCISFWMNKWLVYEIKIQIWLICRKHLAVTLLCPPRCTIRNFCACVVVSIREKLFIRIVEKSGFGIWLYFVLMNLKFAQSICAEWGRDLFSNDVCNKKICFNEHLQVILKAMSEIDPPVQLDDPSNAPSREYLLATANDADFDYPQVCHF